MYLSVQFKKVIDTTYRKKVAAVKAKAAVVGPPAKAAVAAVPAVSEVKEVSHLVVLGEALESNVENIVRRMSREPHLRYYAISYDDDLNPVLSRVTEKPGKRKKAPAPEIAELQDADGNTIDEAVLRV